MNISQRACRWIYSIVGMWLMFSCCPVYAADMGKLLKYAVAAVAEAGYSLNSSAKASGGGAFLSPRAACRPNAVILPSGLAMASRASKEAFETLSTLVFPSQAAPQTKSQAIDQLHGLYPDQDVDRVVNELGNNADRLTAVQLKELVSNRLDNRPDDRPVAIVVVANDDALNPQPFQQDIQGIVSDLQNQGYRIMFYTASEESDVVKALQDGSLNGDAQATTIVMVGHGSQTGMKLDEPGSGSSELDVNDRQKLTAENVGNALKPGGTIAFLSCSVGKGEGEELNLVNSMAAVFPNAKHVYGAVEPVCDIHLIFKDQQLVDVDYETSSGRINAYDGSTNPSMDPPAAQPQSRSPFSLLDIPGSALMSALKRLQGIMF